jgi:hypothetical protein
VLERDVAAPVLQVSELVPQLPEPEQVHVIDPLSPEGHDALHCEVPAAVYDAVSVMSLWPKVTANTCALPE